MAYEVEKINDFKSEFSFKVDLPCGTYIFNTEKVAEEFLKEIQEHNVDVFNGQAVFTVWMKAK